MQINANFAYQPTPPTPPSPAPPTPGDGPLAGLIGLWRGNGFNAIWVPNRAGNDPDRGSGDHFLELNVTAEQLEFEQINGSIPNRGLLQSDLFMAGLHYLQQITDANVDPGDPAGLHLEPGVWLNIPATTDPAVPASVARLGTIPHGTTVLAQGFATTTSGSPTIPAASLTPFTIGNPTSQQPFSEQQLSNTTGVARTAGAGLTGITQAMLDNPNSALATDSTVTSTVTLSVSSDTATPLLGGGDATTAFLGGGSSGPNAAVGRVDATFWLQTRPGDTQPGLLQYSQTVLLNFNGISWPHVSVATLTRQPSS